MSDFEWDEHNCAEVDGHRLDPEEVEEAFYDPFRIPAPAYKWRGEQRRALIALSDMSRVLFIIYTLRGGRIRVITAYPAEPKEQRKYWDRRADRR